MPLHDTNVVPEPGCDSVDVDPLARANRRKGVTHHVPAAPGDCLRFHVLQRFRDLAESDIGQRKCPTEYWDDLHDTSVQLFVALEKATNGADLKLLFGLNRLFKDYVKHSFVPPRFQYL